MSDYEIVETIYGTYHRFDVVRKSKRLGGYEFYVRKDGKPHRGSFSTLRAAVEAAQEDAR